MISHKNGLNKTRDYSKSIVLPLMEIFPVSIQTSMKKGLKVVSIFSLSNFHLSFEKTNSI